MTTEIIGNNITKNYFLLNRESLFHKCKNNSAIYNISSGDILSLNQQISSIIELTENGKSVYDVVQQLHLSLKEVYEILDDISNHKLGNYYSSRVYIEKYKVGSPIENIDNTIPFIRNCYIEFPGECQFDCSFCGQPALFRCAVCTGSKGNANLSNVKRYISRILNMRCENLIIHGGDPLSNIDKLTSVADYIRGLGFKGKILLLTNGSLIDNHIASWFVKYQVCPIIPVFHSTKTKQASYLKSISDLMQRMKIPLTVTNVIVEGENPEESPIRNVLTKIKPDYLLSAVIYGKDNIIRPPTMRRVNADAFYDAKLHHPCLWGTLAMSVEGDILPCPHLRKEVIGSIEDSNFIELIFERKIINDYWSLPLSSLDSCRDCAFQFGCLDCRAVEMQLTGDLYGKSPCKLGKSN